MITVRPMKTADLTVFHQWLYTPHVAKWYQDPLSWIAEVEQQDAFFNWIHHYIVEQNERQIGFCQYYACLDSEEPWGGYTEMGGSYSIDYMIGEIDYIGKGIGKEIVVLLIEKIKQHNDAKRVVVQPESQNKASCGVLLSCGFQYDKEKDIYVLPLEF